MRLVYFALIISSLQITQLFSAPLLYKDSSFSNESTTGQNQIYRYYPNGKLAQMIYCSSSASLYGITYTSTGDTLVSHSYDNYMGLSSIIKYEYDNNHNILKKCYLNKDTVPTCVITYEYSAENKVSYVLYVSYNNQNMADTSWEKYKYNTYDSLEIRTHYQSQGRYYDSTYYAYNEAKHLKVIYHFNNLSMVKPYDSTIYNYNEKGLCSLIQMYSWPGNANMPLDLSEIEYTYTGSADTLTKVGYSYYNGKHLTDSTLYTYNGNNQLIQKAVYNYDNTNKSAFLSYIVSDTYNSYGQILSTIAKAYRQMGIPQTSHIYEYKELNDFPKQLLQTALISDNQIKSPNIDNDDYMLLSFNYPFPFSISDINIDSLLPLSAGHSYLDGLKKLGLIQASSDKLLFACYFSTTGKIPTVVPGDTIIFSNYPFVDTVNITGSFDVGIRSIKQPKIAVFTIAKSIKAQQLTVNFNTQSSIALVLFDLKGSKLFEYKNPVIKKEFKICIPNKIMRSKAVIVGNLNGVPIKFSRFY